MFELVSIAEGYNNELFLYVFTPCSIDNYYLNKVSMYITDIPNQIDIDPHNYSLKCVSNNGKFQKYLVENYTVATGEVYRYYNFVGISRPYLEDLDENITNGYTNDIDIVVNQQFCIYKLNNQLVCERGFIKSLYLEPIYNGHFTLENGITLKNVLFGNRDRKDLHFVAFNPFLIDESGKKSEVDMNHIIDVDIEYYLKHLYNVDFADDGIIFDFPDDKIVYLNNGYAEKKDETLFDDDVVVYEGKGLKKRSYKWNTIYKSSEFIKDFEDIIFEDVKVEINKSEWIFAFASTPNTRSQLNLGHVPDVFGSDYDAFYVSSILDHTKKSYVEDMYECSSFDVLRIKFLDTAGNPYNLGVVMDATTQDLIADGYGEGEFDYTELLEKLLFIISFLILLVIGFYIFPILKIIGKVFMYVLNGIWIIISFPFKIFKKK